MARKALISPGFGAGWSTWIASTDEQREFALFDAPLIAAIESGQEIGKYRFSSGRDKIDPDSPLADFARRYKERFGEEPYLGGARDLEVQEIDGEFQVDEYDGSESVRTRATERWI